MFTAGFRDRQACDSEASYPVRLIGCGIVTLTAKQLRWLLRPDRSGEADFEIHKPSVRPEALIELQTAWMGIIESKNKTPVAETAGGAYAQRQRDILVCLRKPRCSRTAADGNHAGDREPSIPCRAGLRVR